MHACVLIRAMPGKVAESLKDVKKIKGVVKAFPVFGRYDVVAFAQAPDFNSVMKISKQINAIRGIRGTETAIEG
ncbi:MAG: Lrp/AsnC family transcriptional regulator [Candidatus Verstraetearchaeota archaeon]|nr:Lrp/AsnC family transcriptional regulator [Candidatus Verstraetearchaeota archaeon]